MAMISYVDIISSNPNDIESFVGSTNSINSKQTIKAVFVAIMFGGGGSVVSGHPTNTTAPFNFPQLDNSSAES